MQQTMKTTFTLPSGEESDPVVTTKNTGESLADWRARHVAAVTAAYELAWA